MGKKVTLTESKLRELVEEAVRRTINEGLGWESELVDKIDDLKDRIGCDVLLNEVLGKMDPHQVSDIINEISGIYSDPDEEEESFEDEEL